MSFGPLVVKQGGSESTIAYDAEHWRIVPEIRLSAWGLSRSAARSIAGRLPRNENVGREVSTMRVAFNARVHTTEVVLWT